MSDEILHAAQLSPLRMGPDLDDEELRRLAHHTSAVLTLHLDRQLSEAGDAFPENVTAFRPDHAVHGRYRHPCPRCGAPVLRIVRGEHETNYCAACQTGGRVLSDRLLARLLKDDWPTTLDAFEDRIGPTKAPNSTR